MATGQLINATLRHSTFFTTVECTEKLCDVTSTVYCQVQSSCSFVSGDSQMGFDSFVCLLITLMHINTKPFCPACLLQQPSSFLSLVPPQFRSAAACRATIDLHPVHSSVLR